MTSLPARQELLRFDRVGPLYRLLFRPEAAEEKKASVLKRVLISLALTWFPLLILSRLQRSWFGPPPESFLLDLATYARFFMAVPIFIAAERIITPRLERAQTYFVESGLVPQDEMPAYRGALARARRRTESLTAELVLVAIALSISWLFFSTSYTSRVTTWQFIGTDGGAQISLAGLWYNSVAIPVMMFLFLRWLWRLGIWGGFLRSVSGMGLSPVATHPDKAAGLAFVGMCHVPFGMLISGLGCIVSASIASKIVFQGANIEQFKVLLVVYLILFELIFLSPLLLFLPVLMRTRREGLRTYGILANHYNVSFHKKWVEGMAPRDEPLLGSPDIQSLADLGNSFHMANDMRIVPFSGRTILQMSVYALLPLLPLLPLIMPVADILRFLARVIL